MMPGALIVVVDDDASVRSSLARLLASAGYEVRSYASARDLLAAGAGDAACLVLDVHLGGMSGFELDERLRAEGSLVPVVFITAQDDDATRARATRTGAGRYLRKPFDADALFGALDLATGAA
jgi:FixJ family two-component response regulator